MALVPVRHNLLLNTPKYKHMPTQKHTYRQKKYVETKKYTNTKRFAAKRPWPPSWPQLTLNTSSFLHLRQNYFHKSFSPSSKLFSPDLKLVHPGQNYFHQSSEIFSSRSKLLFKFGLNPFYPKTTHDLLPTMGFGAWSFLVSMKLIFFMELHQQSLQYHNITRGAFLRLFSQAELESASGHPCQEFFLLYCPSAELWWQICDNFDPKISSGFWFWDRSHSLEAAWPPTLELELLPVSDLNCDIWIV